MFIKISSQSFAGPTNRGWTIAADGSQYDDKRIHVKSISILIQMSTFIFRPRRPIVTRILYILFGKNKTKIHLTFWVLVKWVETVY